MRHPWRCYTPPSSAENTSNREVGWWDVKSPVRYSLSNCSGYQTRACLSEALCSGSDRARDGSGLAVDALWRLGPQIPVDSALADHLSGSPADTWNGPLQSEVVAYVVFRVRHGRIRVESGSARVGRFHPCSSCWCGAAGECIARFSPTLRGMTERTRGAVLRKPAPLDPPSECAGIDPEGNGVVAGSKGGPHGWLRWRYRV